MMTSCDKDDHDHNHVDIEFLEPNDGHTFTSAEAADVHIHVRFTAEDENHNVFLRLYPEGDESNLILDIDLHTHSKVVDIEEDLDLSGFAPGTEFHVVAEACEDHECEEMVSAEIHFTVN